MGESRKSYYQVSFTGTQALVALLVLLGALALSFFLGAKAGFTRTKAAAREGQAASAPAEPRASSASEAAPPAASAAAAAPTATPAVPPATAASSTGPIVAPTFEDREAGLPEDTAPPSSEIRTAEPSPSRTTIAGSSAPSPAKAPSKPAPAAAAHAPAPRFYVQVLSTSSRSEAGRWKDRLAAKKYKAAVSPVETKKGKLFRVRVGPYTDKEQAKKIAAKISAEEKRQAWVAPAE